MINETDKEKIKKEIKRVEEEIKVKIGKKQGGAAMFFVGLAGFTAGILAKSESMQLSGLVVEAMGILYRYFHSAGLKHLKLERDTFSYMLANPNNFNKRQLAEDVYIYEENDRIK